MRTLLLTMALAVLVAGCNREKTDSKAPEPAASREATSAPPATAAEGRVADAGSLPEPSKEALVNLCADPNPYISNIAKHALSSWEAKDYKAVAIAMGKLVALCKSTTQQSALLSSLAQLKLEVDRAAAKGNANAKEAAAQLAQQPL